MRNEQKLVNELAWQIFILLTWTAAWSAAAQVAPQGRQGAPIIAVYPNGAAYNPAAAVSNGGGYGGAVPSQCVVMNGGGYSQGSGHVSYGSTPGTGTAYGYSYQYPIGANGLPAAAAASGQAAQLNRLLAGPTLANYPLATAVLNLGKGIINGMLKTVVG